MTFAQQIALEKQTAFDVGMSVGRQQTIDMLQIALNREHGFGEKRLHELLMSMKELVDYFFTAFDVKDDECDWYREQLDQALSVSCGKEHPLIPFDERYEYLKKVNYRGKKR